MTPSYCTITLTVDTDDIYSLSYLIVQSMYDIVRDKIVQLVHLSKEHSARLLVKHIEKLPPSLVVGQLKGEPALLHW